MYPPRPRTEQEERYWREKHPPAPPPPPPPAPPPTRLERAWAPMRKVIGRWYVAGAISLFSGWFTLFVIGSLLIGPTRIRCNDGWRSGSSTFHGACSWHGGVDGLASSDGGAGFMMFVAFMVMIGVFALCYDE